MLGLIKKDLLVIKANIKSILVILLIFIMMTFFGTYDITFMIPFMSFMFLISTFSYDDFNNFNAFAVTLPCKRDDIVKSKYLTGLILLITSTILGGIISITTGLLNNEINWSETFSSLTGCIFTILILMSLMMPIIYKFGSEKGRILLFSLSFIFVGVITLIARLIDLKSFSIWLESLGNLLYFILPIIIILILLISYFVSCDIYRKKEF